MEEGTAAPTGVLKQNRFKNWLTAHKKPLLISAPIVGLVIVAAVLWFITAGGSTGPMAITVKSNKVTPPAKVASPLTGILIDADAAKQPVTAVMIENSTDARPQSGLSAAGIVYEALAEGGITRFMALFQEPFPSVLGPVRSVRPYYANWASEYNVPLVHAGGSQPGLAVVNAAGYKNVDGLVQASGFYRATDRPAPHNLYSKADLLSALLTKLKYNTAPTFTGLPRQDDAPPATGIAPLHPKINITFGASGYNVEYDYELATDSYKRLNGGVAFTDRNTTAQISVKNVVVEFVPVSYFTQADGKPATDYKITGSGKAYFFKDGDATVGSWSKTSATVPTQLLDAAGAPVKFNRGTTWFEVVPSTNAVTY